MKSFTETNKELGLKGGQPSEWTAPNPDNDVKSSPMADSGTAKLRTGNPYGDNTGCNKRR